MPITITVVQSALSLALAAVIAVGPIAPATAATETAVSVEKAVVGPKEIPTPVVETKEKAVKTYRVPMTAYSSTPDQTDSTPFYTANGTYVHDGIVAANFLPFHTRVRFPELYGDKVFMVEDRMNKRYQLRVDIWMETRKEAMIFGLKRNVLMEVLPPEVKIATIAKK